MHHLDFEFRALPPPGDKDVEIKGATSTGRRGKMPQIGEHLSFHKPHGITIRLKITLVDMLETPTRIYLQGSQEELEKLILVMGWKRLT